MSKQQAESWNFFQEFIVHVPKVSPNIPTEAWRRKSMGSMQKREKLVNDILTVAISLKSYFFLHGIWNLSSQWWPQNFEEKEELKKNHKFTNHIM